MAGNKAEGDRGQPYSVDGLLNRFLDEAASETRRPNPELTDRIRQIAWRGAAAREHVPGTSNDRPPERIGPYLILEQLGSGGMGSVFRARHTVLERDVALKMLSRTRPISSTAVERFHREMRALATLNHPNVVTAYDGDLNDTAAYLAMELVDGLNLKQLTGMSPSVAECCELIRQTAIGLQALHAAGILHRDIKPSNIMLTMDGRVKVVDLGLARVEEDVSDLTVQHSVMGTEKYMSPEQLRGQNDLDHRTDIFSLGRTLQSLLGLGPFEDNLQQTHTGIPSPIVALVAQMVEPNRDQRTLSADALVDCLAKFCVGADIKRLVSVSDTAEQPVHKIERDGSRVMFAAATATMIVTLIACATWQFDWFSAGSNSEAAPEIAGGVHSSRTTAPDTSTIVDLPTDSETVDGRTLQTQEKLRIERTFAEHWLGLGGSVKVHWQDGTKWTTKTVSEVDDLPTSDIMVQSVTLSEKEPMAGDLAQLAALHQLEGLFLHHPAIADHIFTHCNPDWDLKWVYVPSPEITDTGVRMLSKYQKSLTVLDLASSKATDRSIAFLRTFPLLRGLTIGYSQISDDGLAHFPEFPSLVLLDISGTGVTVAGIQHLPECPRLARLHLNNTELGDEALELLADLSLTELSIKNTRITKEAVNRYISAHPNCDVSY